MRKDMQNEKRNAPAGGAAWHRMIVIISAHRPTRLSDAAAQAMNARGMVKDAKRKQSCPVEPRRGWNRQQHTA
jgi:hypothetical protein